MGEGEGALEGYHDEVKNQLAPFWIAFTVMQNSCAVRWSRLLHGILVECRLCTLPLVNGRKRLVCSVWIEAGRSSSGPELVEKGRLRCEVRNSVRSCAAKSERLKIRKKDQDVHHLSHL